MFSISAAVTSVAVILRILRTAFLYRAPLVAAFATSSPVHLAVFGDLGQIGKYYLFIIYYKYCLLLSNMITDTHRFYILVINSQCLVFAIILPLLYNYGLKFTGITNIILFVNHSNIPADICSNSTMETPKKISMTSLWSFCFSKTYFTGILVSPTSYFQHLQFI